MKLEIHGLDDLESKLKEGADLKLVKEVLKKHATQMHQSTMRKVPADTGALKRSIMLSMHDDGFTWRVKPLIKYAAYVEYGTGIYASNGGGRKTPWVYYNAKLGRYVKTQGMMAQPFVRPAFYEQRNKFMKDIRKIMK